MTGPSSPAVTDAGRPEGQAGSPADGTYGTLDFQRMRHKSQLVKIACDIAAVAKRYRKIHRSLFGLSMRRVLHVLQHNKLRDFAALEIELDSIAAESKLIQQVIDNMGFDYQPKHANMITTIRDALKLYAEAISGAALELNLICRNLRCESAGETGFAGYSTDKFQRDKVAYDSTVQEIRRRGTRLTELFENFKLGQ